jgi:hypothetical protein
MPVHPRLAEWRLSGWSAMMGRQPEADDLIVPLPPAAANARRSRTGEAYRSNDDSGKRWREEDLPALGWRYRELYATKVDVHHALQGRRGSRRDRVPHDPHEEVSLGVRRLLAR